MVIWRIFIGQDRHKIAISILEMVVLYNIVNTRKTVGRLEWWLFDRVHIEGCGVAGDSNASTEDVHDAL